MLERITSRSQGFVRGGLALLLFLVLGPSLMAQGIGELKGTVTDSSGAPVAFALVTTTSADSGYVLPTVTGMDGTYRLTIPIKNDIPVRVDLTWRPI